MAHNTGRGDLGRVLCVCGEGTAGSCGCGEISFKEQKDDPRRK